MAEGFRPAELDSDTDVQPHFELHHGADLTEEEAEELEGVFTDEEWAEILADERPDLVLQALRSMSYDDAEDVAQDSLIRAWLARHSFRGDAKPSTWLYRITENRSSSEHVRAWRRNERAEDDEVLHRVVGDGDKQSVEDEVAESHTLRKLIPAIIGSVGVTAATIIVLHHINGHQHKEIAEMLGLSSDTASKVRMHRALKKLGEQLDPRDFF